MIITIELTPDNYKQLGQIAKRSGKSVEAAAQELLTEKLTTLPSPPQISEREQVREVLRAAGLLTELGPEMKKRAAEATMTLEEVQAALDRAGGQPLSELILEMRGPKE
jgi:plasmid stability protein